MTDRAIQAALTGKPLSGPQKTRLLHALNHVLEQKKLEKVELVALFDPTPRSKKKGEATE